MPQEELRAASKSKETGKDLHQNLAAHRLLPRSLARPKDFLHPLGAELFFKRFQFSVKKFFVFHFQTPLYELTIHPYSRHCKLNKVGKRICPDNFGSSGPSELPRSRTRLCRITLWE